MRQQRFTGSHPLGLAYLTYHSRKKWRPSGVFGQLAVTPSNPSPDREQAVPVVLSPILIPVLTYDFSFAQNASARRN